MYSKEIIKEADVNQSYWLLSSQKVDQKFNFRDARKWKRIKNERYNAQNVWIEWIK